MEEYYYYCLPHIIAPGSRGVLRTTTSSSSHCTRRYYCDYYYCLPHFAPSGVEKWFPRRRSTNQGLHLCSPALSHQAASKVGLSLPAWDNKKEFCLIAVSWFLGWCYKTVIAIVQALRTGVSATIECNRCQSLSLIASL